MDTHSRTDSIQPTFAPAPAPEQQERKPGVLGTFALGVRVWAREMRRILLTQGKRHELRQLQARLGEETALLSRLGAAPGPERELCQREVELLTREIDRLMRENEATEPQGGAR